MTDTESSQHLREMIETRFKGYDEAVRLLQENANRQPTPDVLQQEISSLKEIIEIRFHEWKERTDALALSNKESLNLALQAAEKAAAKAESAFNKQIDALGEHVAQATSSLETRINDNKERVTVIEAGGQGSKQSWGNVGLMVGLLISLVSVVILAITKFSS